MTITFSTAVSAENPKDKNLWASLVQFSDIQFDMSFGRISSNNIGRINPLKLIREDKIYEHLNKEITTYDCSSWTISAIMSSSFYSITQKFILDPSKLYFYESDWEIESTKYLDWGDKYYCDISLALSKLKYALKNLGTKFFIT